MDSWPGRIPRNRSYCFSTTLEDSSEQKLLFLYHSGGFLGTEVIVSLPLWRSRHTCVRMLGIVFALWTCACSATRNAIFAYCMKWNGIGIYNNFPMPIKLRESTGHINLVFFGYNECMIMGGRGSSHLPSKRFHILLENTIAKLAMIRQRRLPKLLL